MHAWAKREPRLCAERQVTCWAVVRPVSTGSGTVDRVADGCVIPARERRRAAIGHGQVWSGAMTLLIDTNAVPAPHRVEFWAKSSCDAYHPLHIGTDGTALVSISNVIAPDQTCP